MMKHLLTYIAGWRNKSFVLLSAVLTLSTFLLASPYSAQAKAAHTANQLADQPPTVTIIILDMSGSMAGNDGPGYRCSAAKAFIDLSGVENDIGLIGLNGDGTKGGPHDFIQAQTWHTPLNMATQNNKKILKDSIPSRSNNSCPPGSTTPTYDALNKALQMLIDWTQNKKERGSVILLTDGAPDNGEKPQDTTVEQINAIRKDLLPKFEEHSWPIDTVALGKNGTITDSGSPYPTFHDFLQNISKLTTGQFYDDSHGPVPDTDALNIGPFFTDIFHRLNNRTLTGNIDPTPLNGDTVSRNFSVAPYTDHLDIVTVKDQASTSVALKDQNNNNIIANGTGVSVYEDKYYVIYSIDQPPTGKWELDAKGTGQFLTNYLAKSALTLSQFKITGPETSHAFAIGQPLTISTTLLDKEQQVTDLAQYGLNGTIAYNGGTDYSQQFEFTCRFFRCIYHTSDGSKELSLWQL